MYSMSSNQISRSACKTNGSAKPKTKPKAKPNFRLLVLRPRLCPRSFTPLPLPFSLQRAIIYKQTQQAHLQTLSTSKMPLPVDCDQTLYSALTSAHGKAAYVATRFVVESIPAAISAAQGLAKCRIKYAVDLHRRASLMMVTMTCVVCLWRPLVKNEDRRDVVIKCHRTLTSAKLSTGHGPMDCVDSALAAVVGSVLDWTEPASKRRRDA